VAIVAGATASGGYLLQPKSPVTNVPASALATTTPADTPPQEPVVEAKKAGLPKPAPVTPASLAAAPTPELEMTPPVLDGTLCNGIRYSSCEIGSDLVCPSNGQAAYCQPIVSEQKRLYLVDSSYVYLTDVEHEELLKQKSKTLRELQDQIDSYVEHSREVTEDYLEECGPDTFSTNFAGGNAQIAAMSHAQICSANASAAQMSIDVDSALIRELQQKIDYIQRNYQ
jgi:hypothetical protein